MVDKASWDLHTRRTALLLSGDILSFELSDISLGVSLYVNFTL